MITSVAVLDHPKLPETATVAAQIAEALSALGVAAHRAKTWDTSALEAIMPKVGLIVVLGGYTFAPQLASTISKPIPDLATRSNTAALGDILYTDYLYYFQISGLILLVAMIGAIVLTLRHKEGVKRQSIAAQVGRTPATGMEIRKVKSGEGV